MTENLVAVGFKKLAPGAIIPTKAHITDSGFDLYAAERVVVYPEATVVVNTGIAAVLPPGYDATIRNRSGITSRTSLRVQLGTIDNSYRGALGIMLDNTHPILDKRGEVLFSNTLLNVKEEVVEVNEAVYPLGSYVIEAGDKIAQLVIHPIPKVVAFEITEEEELGETERGAAGFGSTGTA